MTPDVDRRQRFEAIVAEVYDPLQRYLRRRAAPDDAEELLDDVLLTVWRRLADVPEQATLPWCYGVARRTLANRRRSNNRHLQLLRRLAEQPLVPVVVDEHGRDDHPALSHAFELLHEADREVLRLWAWEGLEPRDIAVVLHATPNAVSLRLGRAKRKLADLIARQDSIGAGHRWNELTEEHGS